MDLQLVNQELCEARLFRSTRGFNTLTGKDVADLLFLNTLVIYMLSRTEEGHDYAVQYAKNTAGYGTYSLFRTFASDLYMLAYQVKHPDNDHARLKDPIASKKFLDSLQFGDRKHIEFLRQLIADNVSPSLANTYFYRLESQMRISDSRYKRWRRMIGQWKTLKYPERNTVIAQITQELRRKGQGTGRGNETLTALDPMVRVRKYSPAAKQKDDKPSLAKRAVGTAVGAAAGRYAADKLNKMDNNKAKNIGTGIGAIAGYWASGRKKQK
jgi:hypothetical protein